MSTTEQPVFVIGQVKVKDDAKWADYKSQVGRTLVPWQGEAIFRGQPHAVFSGQHHFSDVVILKFPTAEAAEGWFNSAAYQALIPLREEAAEVLLSSWN